MPTLQIADGNYRQVLEVLRAFVKKYPGHRNAGDAAQEITALEKRLAYIPRALACLHRYCAPETRSDRNRGFHFQTFHNPAKSGQSHGVLLHQYRGLEAISRFKLGFLDGH
jgi:hypothetical protein